MLYYSTQVEVYDVGGSGASVGGSCTVKLLPNMRNGQYGELMDDLWTLLNIDIDVMDSVR